jgi:uncharacterized FlaG/YvyC family protein
MDVTSIATVDIPIQVAAPQPQVADAGVPAPEVVTQPKHVKNGGGGEEPQFTGPMSKDFIEKTLENINKSLSAYSRELNISIHEKTKILMVKVMDTEQKKVIREIPPEKILDAYARMLELTGILLDKKR